MLKLGVIFLSSLCHRALILSLLSAVDSDSEKETKKRSAKKAFEINFDEDIDFEAHFRKTKVRAEFLPLCNLFCHITMAWNCHLQTGSSHALGALTGPVWNSSLEASLNLLPFRQKPVFKALICALIFQVVDSSWVMASITFPRHL